MKVLFIGGTGVISSACSELAIQMGIELYLLNRGQSKRPIARDAIHLQGDIRQPDNASAAIGDMTFDSVVEWLAFTPDQVQSDIELFRNRTRQYGCFRSVEVHTKSPTS